ncbi:MAG: twin-arginine translocase TatA/TatE family subunit [Gracilibacteraceae bacterium]|jgi:sec-independent protein translocase protein TatA|nr:twin-arginine translocase TatA/TatE family subunit [Gracilibacteraceae bacterium]
MTVFGVITPTVAVVILVVALIIFGPGKLPDLGKSLGRGIKEFKDATGNGDEKQPPQLAQSAPPQDAQPPGTKTE